jgi:phage-related minor tail protein
MASTAGSVLLEVSANLDRLKGDIEKAMSDAGDKAGKTFSSKFEGATAKMGSVGKSMTKNVTLPLVAAGTAAVAAGLQVDDAFDKIRTGTGATGAALEGLQTNFRNVAKTIPASFEDVSTAVADVNQRLGLTGTELETRSSQFLELSRITGDDLAGSIESVTAVFNQFNVEGAAQTTLLDDLFQASQASGVSVAQLADDLSKSGAVLGQFGLSVTEGADLLALLGENGISGTEVTRSLTKVLQEASKAGVPASQALQVVSDAIKGASTEAEAAGIALDVFGPKAGPKLAAQIRDGTLSLSDFEAQLGASQDTILGVGEATADFPEQMQKFKNQLGLALSDVGTKLFPVITDALNAVLPPLISVIDAFSKADPTLQKVILAVLGVIAAIGPVLSIASKLSSLITGVNAAFTFLAANPVVLVLLAIAAAAFLIYKNWDKIEPVLRPVFDFFQEVGAAIYGFFVDTLLPAIQGVWNWIKDNWDILLAVLTGPFGLFVLVIKRWGGDILNFFRGLWDKVVAVFRGALNAVKAVVSTVFNAIKAVVETVWGAVRTYIEFQIGLITGAFNLFKGAVEGVWNGIKSVIQTAAGIIGGIFDGLSAAVDKVRGAFETAGGLIASGWTWVKDTVSGAVEWIVEKLTGLKDWLATNADKLLGPLDEIAGFVGSGIGKAANLIGLASGGTAYAGQPYLIGEEGPELMIPGRTGQVVPTDRLLAALGTGGRSGDSYAITVVNPIAEPPSLSVARLQRRQALLTGRSS